MLEIFFLFAIICTGIITFSVFNSRGSQQAIKPMSDEAIQHIVQKLGFQEAKNKRFGYPRYVGKYQEYNVEIFVDSDEFFTIQMFFTNSKNLIFQIQKKSSTSLLDKAIWSAYSDKDIFTDPLSYKKFAIYTRPDNLREKIFYPDSPIWTSLRKLPSSDCSLEIGFSVRELNALTYQHFYAKEVDLAMIINLLKLMSESCETLQNI